MGCILEDKVSPNVNLASTSSVARVAGRRGSRVPSLGGSRGSSRRGSTDLSENLTSSMDAGLDKSNTFSYWLKVTVVPSVS